MDKWDKRFLEMAKVVATWSSCYQENRHVGAVIVKDKRIMTTGSLDEFLDFLDFAPAGGISVAKDLAIKLPLTDMNKAEALTKATGFDVMKALEHTKAVERDLNGAQEAPAGTRTRRVTKQTEEPKKYRRIDN